MKRTSGLGATGLPTPLSRSELFEPDIITADQWFARRGMQSPADASPTTRLMLAVLEDAVGQYRKLWGVAGKAAAAERAELDQWFASPQIDFVFSFRGICSALGLAADAIEAKLRQGPPWGYEGTLMRRGGAGLGTMKVRRLASVEGGR